MLTSSSSSDPATLTVGGNSNSTIFNGTFGDYSATVSYLQGNLVKTGLGTLTLGGSNTYTGSTTITGGGALQLDFTQPGAPPPIFLSPASSLVMNGGSLEILGVPSNAVTQTVTQTTNCSGAIGRTTHSAGRDVSLALGNLSRNAGGVVAFVLPSVAFSDRAAARARGAS